VGVIIRRALYIWKFEYTDIHILINPKNFLFAKAQ
jgi:hypothetical protein